MGDIPEAMGQIPMALIPLILVPQVLLLEVFAMRQMVRLKRRIKQERAKKKPVSSGW